MARRPLPAGSHGEISTRALPEGGWEARAYYRTLGGEKKDATRRAGTKPEAVRRLRAALAHLTQQEHADPSLRQVPFRTVADEWLRRQANRVDSNQLSRGTLANYQRLMRAVVVPEFGDQPIRTITTRAVSHTYEKWHAKWPAQARHSKTVVRQVMELARLLGHIDRNPVGPVVAYRRPEREIFAPSPAQLADFRSHAVAYVERPNRMGPTPSPLLLDVVDLILGTGLRLGEALGLRWEQDVFLADRATRAHIVINGSIKEVGGSKRWEPRLKTSSSYRTIDIPANVVEMLERRRSIQASERGAARESAFVFHTSTGRPNGQQDVHRATRSVRAWAGLSEEYVPHALRRTVASTVADAMGLESAARLLGHKRSRVTEQFYAKRHAQTPDATGLLGGLHDLIAGEPGE